MLSEFLANMHRAAATAEPINSHVPEAKHLSDALAEQCSAEAVGLATLLHLSESLLRRFGETKGHDVGPLIALQRDCVRAWMEERGFDEERLDDAIDGMRQAARTVRYLAAIPG